MRTVSILAAMTLAACGSSSSSSPTYVLEDAAALLASGSCSITGVGPIGASVALVGASDYAGACTSMTDLTIPAGGAFAQFIIVRVDISSTTPPPLNTGTYPFYDLASGTLPPADPASPLNGFKFFAGLTAKCAAADGGGGGTAPEAAITGGSVAIDAVTPNIHGTLSAAIEGGTSIGGTFTSPTCATAGPLDVAALCTGVNTGGLTFPTFTCQ